MACEASHTKHWFGVEAPSRGTAVAFVRRPRFHRHRVSRPRRTQMGVRIEVRDGESVEQAVKRFTQLVWRHGPPGAGRKRPKWHKPPLDHYLKPSELARRDELRDAFETYSGECARRRLVCVIRRKTKRRKERFGDAPVVCQYPVPQPLPWWA